MSQPLLGTNETSLSRAFRAIENDLQALGSPYPWINSVETMKHNRGNITADLMHEITCGVIDRSTAVVMNGPIEGEAPLTKFGKALVAASKLPDVGYPHEHDGCCQEAEPRLFRSLDIHITGVGTPNKQRYEHPAVIILGEGDEPIGYEKTSGTPSTYVWDQTTVQTERGVDTIPADSFAYIKYSDAIEDVYYECKAGAIAVRANPDNLVTFGLLRLSTRSYPTAVRTAMAHASAEMKPALKAHINTTLSFKPQDVKERVVQLMSAGNVPIIG